MEHHAHADAGADVRRAGGEIAEAVAVGVGDAGFDQVVELVDLLPGRVEVEAAVEHLDPQVVLFVDHHADLLARIDGDAARALGLGMLAADQLPLDEELAVDLFQRADVDVDQLAGELALRRGALDPPRRILPISSRSLSVARAMNGKSARLRARRMRLVITMSDSGPEPRSHSPLVLASSCS